MLEAWISLAAWAEGISDRELPGDVRLLLETKLQEARRAEDPANEGR